MNQNETISREDILRQMLALALCPANDAVRLTALEGEADVGDLDLRCLTEFKRNANGAVEVKLADRAGIFVKVLEQLRDQGNTAPAAFLEALDRREPPEEGVSRR